MRTSITGQRDIVDCELVDARTGQVIERDTEVTDFRGDKMRYMAISQGPVGGSTGKVWVMDGPHLMEYYPSVVGGRIRRKGGE